MSEKKIKVARYRNVPYTVNYEGNGMLRTFKWSGSKDGKNDVQEIPEHVVDHLMMRTQAFSAGELVIQEEEKNKEIIQNIDHDEDYKKNINTRANIKSILNKSTAKMTEALSDITDNAEKRFVISVAKDMDGIMNVVSKRRALAEFMDTEEEVLFADVEG